MKDPIQKLHTSYWHVHVPVILICIVMTLAFGFSPSTHFEDYRFLSFVAHPSTQQVDLYWKDPKGMIFGSLGNIKSWSEQNKKQLLFATNGGMYKTDQSPLGLFIQNGKTISRLNTQKGNGNFYLEPNGVFYLTNENKAFVCATDKYPQAKNVKHATQSGPMLVLDGVIHSAFKQGSQNLNIRNGVGILPDGNILFAISKEPVNLYDFASWFKEMGCNNALYLDGFVSRAYHPAEKWIQTDGSFGVIIAVTTD